MSAPPAASAVASGAMVDEGNSMAGEAQTSALVVSSGPRAMPRRRPAPYIRATPRASHTPPAMRPAVTRSSTGVSGWMTSAISRVPA
jgi:hypothetical protein